MPQLSMQEIINKLQTYWAEQGCAVLAPYNSEVGAGTFNPATFIRVLDSKPWKVVYCEPSKRPRDGRYGKNPLRVQQFWQLQVILKPTPADIQARYLESLETIGVNLNDNDIRFIEDDWESPTLGAWGLGWQVELNGIEITQFTYFQQCGSIDLKIIPVELTYGLERIAMFVQGVDSIFSVRWNDALTWGDIYQQNEEEFSRFNFEEADVHLYHDLFDRFEAEAQRLLKVGLVYPGYDHVIKCSHFFNLLEARGSISVSERQHYIARVRRLARLTATTYLAKIDKTNRSDMLK
ncbi:glycine--tRNA ligase subunit alpha [candidate division WOR-3 bacterium JGI_Cruoil_03_51_56]|uniref:Glycine--tRNA ligase alpha subunit n=1 Tax=candidate division WOR-3 bacterium JGI_Cruoil_03_51_56 TaxID=1973747 RepID=A0A235BY31_UNCW3|nr:MAG: glycine--tRNA ligase subunit alpha [candidate division WOR-3 bacterium JGI_Cruoil_03_51_56]